MLQSKHKSWLLFLLILASSTAVPLKSHLVRFYPISRNQYDSILRMTAGQPIISEGRLVNSGFRTLSNWRTAISSDISNGWQQLLNITGLLPINTKATEHKVEGYPLCVIKANDLDDENGAETDTNLQHARDADESSREDNSEDERPVVNCIVVVKQPDGAEFQQHYIEQEQLKQKLHQPIEDSHHNHNQNQNHHSHHQQNQKNQRRHENHHVGTLRSPYPYYPPYPYPVYPYYNYPFYPEARSGNKKIEAKLTKPADLARSSPIEGNTKESQKDESTGRSGYTGYPSYPGYYPGYPNYGGYGNYGSYPQGYPYTGGYSGCQNNFNPYGQFPYASDNNRHSSNEDDEDSDASGEVAGEIGGEEF